MVLVGEGPFWRLAEVNGVRLGEQLVVGRGEGGWIGSVPPWWLAGMGMLGLGRAVLVVEMKMLDWGRAVLVVGPGENVGSRKGRNAEVFESLAGKGEVWD